MSIGYQNLVLLAALSVITSVVAAQDRQFEIGFRPLMLASQGEPSNDMLGGGIVGTWHWRDDWFFGAGSTA